MSFFLVDNACLNSTKPGKDASNLTFRTTGAAYKQCTTKHSDMVARKCIIPLDILGLAICRSRGAWLSSLWTALTIFIAIIATTTLLTPATAALTSFKALRITIRTGIWIVDTVRGAFPTGGVRRRFTHRRSTPLKIRRSTTVSHSSIVLFISVMLRTILGDGLDL